MTFLTSEQTCSHPSSLVPCQPLEQLNYVDSYGVYWSANIFFLKNKIFSFLEKIIQLKIIKSGLILENCFSSKNCETSFKFLKK
jgi:hypothetical protein